MNNLTPLILLGGTFDPIHNGHLQSALSAQAQLGGEVCLIPNHIPPHRPQPIASSAQRLEMVQLAAARLPNFSVDPRELLRDRPSYTVETLEQLRTEQPERPLAFLIGMDSLLSLPSWHRWQDLLTLAHLIVAVRPGWTLSLSAPLAELLERCLVQDPKALSESRGGSIWIMENPPLAISATELRAELCHGIIDREALPEAVADFLSRNNLYLGRDG